MHCDTYLYDFPQCGAGSHYGLKKKKKKKKSIYLSKQMYSVKHHEKEKVHNISKAHVRFFILF